MSETIIISPYCASTVFKVRSRDCRLFDPYKRTKRISLIAMYKTETDSWDRVTSFDLGSREGVCVVAKDNFIYFVVACVASVSVRLSARSMHFSLF